MVCETRDLWKAADKVVPLGFVVTELVTNSAKYAYPEPLIGQIRVSLMLGPEGWVLTIEDSGTGLSRKEARDAGGLGTLLVRRFVQQIGAEIVTTSEKGVRHQITLKNDD